MVAKTYYYARVSSSSQSLARQLEVFKADGADEHDIITEKASGKSMDRPEYQAMRNHMLRPGDTLVVQSLDRLGRNKEAIKDELNYYRSNDIRVRILDLPTSNFKPATGQEWILDMVNNIIIEVLASQAEQERINIRQRQAEGIAAAKAAGRYHGGVQKKIDEEKLQFLFEKYRTRRITKAEFARQMNVPRPTLNRILKKRQMMVADTLSNS